MLHLLLSPALWSAVLAVLPNDIVTNQPKPKIIAMDIKTKDHIMAMRLYFA